MRKTGKNAVCSLNAAKLILLLRLGGFIFPLSITPSFPKNAARLPKAVLIRVYPHDPRSRKPFNRTAKSNKF
jgi:hypothetical protein